MNVYSTLRFNSDNKMQEMIAASRKDEKDKRNAFL